jgi:5-methyltetrahydrofolate--homocysteine methyltransferase
LVLTAPQVIAGSANFFKAGSDIVETNTFGGTVLSLPSMGCKTRPVKSIARLPGWRKQLLHSTALAKPRFVAGSMGPTTKTISVTGGVDFDQLRKSYAEQAEGLLMGASIYSSWKPPKIR